MNIKRVIKASLAASFLLLSLPAAAWAEPIDPANLESYGTEPWLAAEAAPEIGLSQAELDYHRDTARNEQKPSTSTEAVAESGASTGIDAEKAYQERIEAAANTAPVAPAWDVEAYYKRIEAAVNTVPQMPADAYLHFGQEKVNAVPKPLTRSTVQ